MTPSQREDPVDPNLAPSPRVSYPEVTHTNVSLRVMIEGSMGAATAESMNCNKRDSKVPMVRLPPDSCDCSQLIDLKWGFRLVPEVGVEPTRF